MLAQALALFLCAASFLTAAEQTDLFMAGEEGYHTFRIPSLLATPKNVALAFCEGRRRGTSDTGDIDVLLKRSLDSGKTWKPIQVIAEDGSNTFGNPCALFDRNTGTIWLALTHNLGEDSEAEILDQKGKSTRTVWMLHSKDEGASWSKPVEITKAVKPTNWTWYATGPGVNPTAERAAAHSVRPLHGRNERALFACHLQ